MTKLPPLQLSEELRLADHPHLKRRRKALLLSLAGVAAGSVVGLYQMGLLKRLPDYPSRFFDATRVDASTYGYKFLQSPDALLMIASYALTAVLAGAGGKDRAQLSPALPIAFAVKALTDVIVNLYLAKEEWRYNRAFCGYCQTATLASIATTLLAIPEAREAIEELRSGRAEGEVSLELAAA